MALPYPSMDFVPFDILTAAELDELSANDQALAAGTGINDGAVGTTQLADASITTAKLALSKTTDPNGWTVYDYGTWKKYAKRITWSVGSIGQLSPTAATLSSNNIPSALSNFSGTSFMWSWNQTTNAFGGFAHLVLGTDLSTGSTLSFSAVNLRSTSQAYGGTIDIVVTT